MGMKSQHPGYLTKIREINWSRGLSTSEGPRIDLEDREAINHMGSTLSFVFSRAFAMSVRLLSPVYDLYSYEQQSA